MLSSFSMKKAFFYFYGTERSYSLRPMNIIM